MTKKEAVLMALAAANGAHYQPVQIQKLMFLLDRKIPESFGGPIFSFQAYDYGPFDKTVYDTIEELTSEGLAKAVCRPGCNWSEYGATVGGQEAGQAILSSLPDPISAYIRELSAWVRTLSFRELVGAIYRAYPEMKINSVFSE